MNIDNRISRRLFLALSGSASLVPPVAWAAGDVPLLLDHVLLGCADLDRTIDFVAQAVGVHAAFGGVHPGRGTRNALLALGERRYLEIIAPDPKQDGIEGFAQKQVAHLKQLASPHLIGWAAHPGDLEKFSVRLREAGIAFDGPRPARVNGLTASSCNGKPSISRMIETVSSPSSSNGAPIRFIPRRTRLKAAGSLISEDLLQIQMNLRKSVACCNSSYPSPAVTSPHSKPRSSAQRVSSR